MGVLQHLILIAYLVNFALASDVHQLHHHIMNRQVRTIKDRLQIARNGPAYKRRNLYSNVGEKVILTKREIHTHEEEDEYNPVYETKYPYPQRPVENNWSYEMSTIPYEESKKVYREIGELITQLIDTLSYGDPKKKQQLTLLHAWVPLKGALCYDSMRLMLSTYCVEWRLSEFARRYGYVLVNMCNAKWLNEEDIEEAMARTCEKKKIPDDKCM